MTGFLQALAEAQPLALFIDDLHWADQASIDLLLHLARFTRASPILLLGTYRDDEVSDQHPLGRGAGRPRSRQLSERIHVQSLSFGGVRSLIAATLGEAVASEEFTQILCDRTEGNPFFAHEVMRTLIESSDVLQHDGAWDLAAIKQLEIPESVRTGIAQRFHRLSPTAQGVLHEASILGQTFAFDDLQAMNGHSEAEIEGALEEGLGARLLDEVDGDHVGFHHALIYEALYHDLTAHKRLSLHRRAGEAIERLPERMRIRRAADLAHHFRAAGESARALPICCLPVIRPRQFMRTAKRKVSIAQQRKWRVNWEIKHKRPWRWRSLVVSNILLRALRSAKEAYDHACPNLPGERRHLGSAAGEREVGDILSPIWVMLNEVGRCCKRCWIPVQRGEPATSVAEMYIELAWLSSDPVERLAACERAAEIARVNGDNHMLALAEFARGNVLIIRDGTS